MAFSKESIAALYQKRSGWYDFSANTHYLIGFREFAYRQMAIQELHLNPGDTVVEIGCGTGLNFEGLLRRIGPQGHVVGVDLTPEMLAKASDRVARNHWANVCLIQSDAAGFEFPRPVDGVFSTFALTLVPEYDRVIQNAAAALPHGKRLVILDFKMPAWPMWLIKLFVILTRPFGITLDLGERHPWESVDRHLETVVFKELYFGGVYICAGEAGHECGSTGGRGPLPGRKTMNPKKRIMEYLSNPPCRHPADETCDECDQVRRIMDGMSEGTASLVIESAAGERWGDDFEVEALSNKGRYYTASIVYHDGTLFQKLIVDKQTGDVRFV